VANEALELLGKELRITNHKDWKTVPPPDSHFELRKLVDHLRPIRVAIHDDRNETQHATFLDASAPLAFALLSATTRHAARNIAIPDLVDAGFYAGLPSMYIRAASDETLSAGIDESVTQLRSGESRQLTLVRDRASHFELPIWIQQYDFKDGSVESQEERDLRVLLSRFNAEQYSMASFQRWATQTPSPIDRTGKSAEFYDALFKYSVLRLLFSQDEAARVFFRFSAPPLFQRWPLRHESPGVRVKVRRQFEPAMHSLASRMARGPSVGSQ